MAPIKVHLERGFKRTFATAVDWPGWSRSGRDDADALRAVVVTAGRYARALAGTRLGFQAPAGFITLHAVSRSQGTTTTDFGAPDAELPGDSSPMTDADLRRTRTIFRACWRAFDKAVQAARGKTLATGPRGGGRSVEKMIAHVVEAERGYISALGAKAPPAGASVEDVRAAVMDSLTASARGELAPIGPRGGKRWNPRFFARRLAWHALDHAWEIEDRIA